MFTLYDALGRPVVSGTCTNSIDYIGNPIRDMVVTASISTNSELKGYTCSYQINSPAVLTVNYYDNYDFRTFIPEISFDIGAGTEFNKQYTGGYKGLLTGTLTAVLDVNTTPGAYLYSVFFYDYRGQVIQTVSSNHLGGTEKEYITYTFIGQPEKRKHVHTAPGKSTQTETYGYDYDHAERLARTRYTLNSGPEILMSQNTYDELGRLKTTTPYRLGNFKSTYTYTVRSWISQINSNLYLEDLTYKFNGNVETMQWIQGGTTRKYTFGYDGLSRLKTADYDIPGSERLFVLDLDLFSASYGYDKHGNMTNLTRYGLKAPGNYDLIDNLTLNYGGSNQLKYVNDAGHEVLLSTSYDFKNYSSGADEYAYNANGSMTKDLNKGITSILYNAIGLPMHINIQNPVVRARNNYTYSADGKKLHVYYEVNGTYLSAPISGSSSLRVTQPIESWKNADYCGNILYEDDALKGILTENGYYDGENYYFYIRNHLGSNVITATKDGNIVQHTHYYPFGLTMGISTNQGVQPYKYTGKELDMEHGLMQYDFEARTYDPAVGRFLSIDPLCEKYYWISPYAYCVNNPVKFIDPDGRDIILRNVFRTNDRGNYDARKGKVSGKTQSALSDLMKTTEVKNFFAQFAKKGDKIGDYTFTENGTLSNKTLELNDYSFEEGYNSNLPLSREGSIGVDKDKGMVKVEIFSYGESKEDIGEIITHETQLHGYNVKDKLEGKSTMSGDKDHAALKSKNASHRGYKKYDSTRQQLKKIDSNYEKSFKEAERHAKEHY
jgi:RHS repeat-associated protein